MKYWKAIMSLLVISILSFVSVTFLINAASFNKYAPKLLKFEGQGYGIHKPIWGERMFTKEEALQIHKHYYWNRYHGNSFKSQQVAEVLIDHLINAGQGRNLINIKAFEKIIGVEQDGVLSLQDIEVANNFEHPEEIVNPYVEHRLRYYRTRKDAKKYPGWFKRAKSFYIDTPKESENTDEDDMVLEDYIVPPKK